MIRYGNWEKPGDVVGETHTHTGRDSGLSPSTCSGQGHARAHLGIIYKLGGNWTRIECGGRDADHLFHKSSFLVLERASGILELFITASVFY